VELVWGETMSARRASARRSRQIWRQGERQSVLQDSGLDFEALDSQVAATFQDVLSWQGWRLILEPTFPIDDALEILHEVFAAIEAVGSATADVRSGLHAQKPGDRNAPSLRVHDGGGCTRNANGAPVHENQTRTSPAMFAAVAVWRRIGREAPPAALLGAEYLYEQLTALVTHEAECILRLRGVEPDEAGLDALADNDAADRANGLRERIFEAMTRDATIAPALLFGHDCLAQVYPVALFDEALTRALEG
jgi:hypothetical protein